MPSQSFFPTKRKQQASPHTAADLTSGGDASQPVPRMHALVAKHWANVIVNYWEACLHEGLLDRSQPIDIVDLMPGPSGVNTWMMHQALSQRLSGSAVGRLRYRLLPVASDRKHVHEWRALAEWQQAESDGQMVPLLWNRLASPCLLHPSGRREWRPQNPVALLVHQMLAARPRQVYAAHYGKLLQAPFERLLQGDEDGDNGPWRPADPACLPDRLAASLQAILARFNSVPLAWPTEQISALESLFSMASNGYLALIEAPGEESDRSIRLRTFAEVVQSYRDTGMVPLNFRLLAEYFTRCGGISAAVESRCQRRCMQAVIGGPPGQVADLPKRVFSIFDQDEWARHTPLLIAMKALAAHRDRMALDSALINLQCAAMDPDLFSAAFQSVLASIKNKQPIDRDDWIEAARAVWTWHLPVDGSLLHREIAAVAMRMGDWGFARRVLLRGLQSNPRQASDLGYLAWCELRTGRSDLASSLLEQALSIDRHDPIAGEVKARLLERRALFDQAWRKPIAHPTLPFVLEPLDCMHAEALLVQYRDPQIAIMTGLQALSTVEQVRKWIIEHDDEAGRHAYAVMHRDHGLVAYVCLSNSAHASYFCFWVGVDYQGQALSAPAASLLCDYGRQLGITQFYTSIYDDNIRSVRSLVRVGFKPMRIRALEPDQDRCFYYYCDPDVTEEQATRELIDYHVREKLPLRFPGTEPETPPLADASSALVE
jgi:RimJ/RimL family protein N-acetyltransferase